VIPDERQAMTRDDLLDHNVDLLECAASILAGMQVRALSVMASASGSGLTLAYDVAGIDRLDVYVDGRPLATEDVTAGAGEITVPAAAASPVRVDGFQAGELVGSRVLSLARATGLPGVPSPAARSHAPETYVLPFDLIA